jgi:ArsR family transcriptional regulator
MTNLTPYTPDDEKLARYAKAMAHPARIFILRFLENQQGCFAGNIAEKLPIAASTVSQHLKELKDAGLIRGTINPPTIKYCIEAEKWAEAKALFDVFFEKEITPTNRLQIIGYLSNNPNISTPKNDSSI